MRAVAVTACECTHSETFQHAAVKQQTDLQDKLPVLQELERTGEEGRGIRGGGGGKEGRVE